MIEACIFDIGGTLVRTEDALLEAIKETLLANNLTPPPDREIFIHFGIGYLNIFRKVIPSIYKEGDVESVIQKCYNQFEAGYPDKFLGEFQPMPDAENCLRELSKKGIKTACQTGMGAKEARTLLERFNLLKHFQVLVAFEDVAKPRPNPEAMYLTMRRLGVSDKNKCLYIGDTINDIRFAKNAGVKIACVTTGPQSRELLEKEEPDYIIDNLMELPKLILG